MDIYDHFLDSDMSWEEAQATYTPPETPEIPEVPGLITPEAPTIAEAPPAPKAPVEAKAPADPLDAFLDTEVSWEEFTGKLEEPEYAALGLPVVDFEREGPTEPFTFRRLGEQAIRAIGQGIADIGRFAKAFAEKRDLKDPMPFPDYTGWEQISTDPTAIQSYDQRQFGTILRDITEEEGAKPTPERIDQEWEKYLTEKKTAAMQGAQDFIEAFPEIMEGSSGIVEDAVTGMARFLPSMGVSAVNPIAGTAMTYAQLMGSSYGEYRERGVDPEKAFSVASLNALAQTPLEMAGNLLQIGALKNIARSVGTTAKMGEKVQKLAGAFLTGALGEGSEEFLQQYPEEIANYYLANPDLSPKEIAALVWENKDKIAKKGLKAAKVGAVGGVLLAGGFQMVAAPFDVKEYISEKQRKINEKKGVKVEQPKPVEEVPAEEVPAEEVVPPEAPPEAPAPLAIDDVRAQYEAGTMTDEDLESIKEIMVDDTELVAGIDEILAPKAKELAVKAELKPEVKAPPKPVAETLVKLDKALEARVTDPGTHKLAKHLIETVDPSFAVDSTIDISDEVRLAAPEIIKAEGLPAGEYVIAGETVSKFEDDTIKSAISLYKGHDADTLVEEWYHRFYDRMTEADKKAFNTYHEKLGDPRKVHEHFAQEGRDFFFAGKLHEEAGPIRSLFETARDSLKLLINRVRKLRGAKIPENIQTLYREAGEGVFFEEAEKVQAKKPPAKKPPAKKPPAKAKPKVPPKPKPKPKAKPKAVPAVGRQVKPAEDIVTGKDQIKDVRRAFKVIKGGKHEYIDKIPEGDLDEAERVRREDAEAEVAVQITTLKSDRFADQTISTVVEAQNWLEAHGFPRIAKPAEASKLIGRLLQNEEFQKLSIFDQIRISAQVERPIRKADYRPVVSLGGNRKTAGLQGTGHIGNITREMGDSEIRITDAVAGCDHYCYECYALKGAPQATKSHQHPILTKVNGYLRTGEVLRVGEKGDPCRCWSHTVAQVRAVIERSRQRGQDITAENVYYTTKLINLNGFDPEVVRHIQVTLDPLYPDHMVRTMQNILRLKSAHPDVVIVARVRSFHSTNPDLKASLQTAVDFANKYKIPILETRLRFIRKASFDLLQLDEAKYKRVGNQFKMKSPALKEESENYYLCDMKDMSCPSCKNCINLVKKRKELVPVQAKAIQDAGIDGLSIEDTQKFDPVGVLPDGSVPSYQLRPKKPQKPEKELTDKQREFLEKHYPERLKRLDEEFRKKSGGKIIDESKEDSEKFAEMGEIPSSPEGFNMPHEGLGRQAFNLFQFKVQDRLNSLRRVQETIEDVIGTEVAEDANAYQVEELYHGKVAERIGTFDSEHIDPLVEAIHESKFELEDVEEYLYARHAPEANKQLEKLNPKVKNNKALSGLSNEDAEAIMARYAGDKNMQKIAGMVDAITKGTRDVLVDEGLATAEEIKAWENTYKYYVPLKRAGKDVGLPKRGQGVNIRGPESKRRLTGSAKLEAVNILANIISQHEAVLIRAEKAKVGRAMLKLAEAHPNKELWAVDVKALKPFLKQRKSDVIDEETGLPQTLNEVVYGRDVLYKLNDNVLVVKVDGLERTITFNEENVHAQRIVRSLKNLGATDMSAFISILSRVNRFLAIVNTSANPEFIISNFARDIQTAGYNISDTAARNMKKQVFKDVFRALQGIRRGLRGDFTSEWAKNYQAFVKAGAQTGWTDHYKNVEEREKVLKKKLDLMKDGTFRSMQRMAKGLFDFVGTENTAVENAIRLSIYTNLKKAGATDAVAASAAKNLTVNFNRRGDMGQTLNAMYLFFNANVQGSARLIYAAARSPKVRKMMYATVAFATMLDLANRWIGGEDDDGENRYDKVPHWVKEHNLVIMRPNGDYFKIPLPWGYNTLHVLGQSIGEAVDPKADKFDAIAAAGRLGSAILGSFNPLGSESTLLQLAAPTIADPFVQVAENKNFAGIPIKPEQMPFDVSKPEYQLYFQSAGKIPKWIAKQLSDLTGGDEVRPGLVDVSPEVFDHFIETMIGGAGRFLDNALALPAEVLKPDIEIQRIPVIRKIYGEAPDFYLRTKFYDNLSEIRYAQKSVDHYEDDPDKATAINKRYSWEMRFVGRAKRDKARIQALRKERRRIEIGDEPKATKERKVQEIEKKIAKIMTDFNRTYKKRSGATYMAPIQPEIFTYTHKPLTIREATQIK